MKNIYVTVSEDDDDDTKIIKHKSEDGEETIIIKKISGDHDDIHMIVESEFDDEDIDIKVIDGDTIIKKCVKTVTVKAGEEGTYNIYINDDEGEDVKKMMFISDDGETEIITEEGENKYVIITKDSDGDSDKKNINVWVSDDSEKIEIKKVGEDGDMIWVSDDGEVHEVKDGKVIIKEIEITIEEEDDKDKDKDKKKDKKKDK